MKVKTHRARLYEYLTGLYVPVSKREEFAQLLKIVNENDYKSIEDLDEKQNFRDSLVIETLGCGIRETFKGYKICRVDVGKVGVKMADIAIFENGCDLAIPKRVAKGTIKINLLREWKE